MRPSIIIFLTIFVSVFASEESTHNRILKHKEWLNQRRLDRKLVGYVETDDPYQKIKYFKKLIKFKNKETPSKVDDSLFLNIEKSNSIEKHLNERNNINSHVNNDVDNNEDVTTISNVETNKFAYETVNEFYEHDDVAKKTSFVMPMEHKVINESNKKHENSSDVVVTSKQNLIEKEKNSNKINHNEENANIEADIAIEESKSFKNSKIHIVHNETISDFETQKFLYDHVKYKSSNLTLKNLWGKWSSWSQCSRSCGKGVMSQSRNCMLKMYKHGKRINVTSISLNECIGFYKRFKICNENECPQSSPDFRSQQCSEFNNKTFKGLTYEWEPFLKEDAECELNCRPKNQKYFARLGTVIDGTLCTKVSKNQINYEYAVCVEGKCKVIHDHDEVLIHLQNIYDLFLAANTPKIGLFALAHNSPNY